MAATAVSSYFWKRLRGIDPRTCHTGLFALSNNPLIVMQQECGHFTFIPSAPRIRQPAQDALIYKAFCAHVAANQETASMLESISYQDFESLIGHKIMVSAGGSKAELEVREVHISTSPSPRALPPFRVVLCARDNWQAAQGMFQIQHPKLGELELFTVPVGPDVQGFCYEIIFN